MTYVYQRWWGEGGGGGGGGKGEEISWKLKQNVQILNDIFLIKHSLRIYFRNLISIILP